MEQHELLPSGKLKIQQALPEFVRFPNQDFRVKRNDYFNSNESIWDRKSHSSNKQYKFYLKKIDDQQPIVNIKKEEDILDKILLNQQRQKQFDLERQNGLHRLIQRKAERIALQRTSEQNVELNDQLLKRQEISQILQNQSKREQYALKRTQQYRIPQSIADNKWNDLSKLSKKQINLLLRPEVIKNDEKAVLYFLEKLNEDHQIQLLRKNAFIENRQKLRQKFLQRKSENNNILKRFSNQTSFISDENSFMKNFIQESNRQMQTKSLEKLRNYQPPQQISTINSQNIDKKLYQPRHPFDYPETTGLLLSTIDSKVLTQGGDLSKKVVKHSTLLKGITDQNISKISAPQLSQIIQPQRQYSLNTISNNPYQNEKDKFRHKRILDELELSEQNRKRYYDYDFPEEKRGVRLKQQKNNVRNRSQDFNTNWDFRTNIIL